VPIELARTSIQSNKVPLSFVSSRHDDTPEGPDEPGKSGTGRLRTALKVLGQSSLFSDISFKTLLRAIGQVPNSDLSAAESESTLFRFFRSCHIRDLKLIATAALVICAVHFGTVLLLALSDAGYHFFSGAQHDPVAALSKSIPLVINYVAPAIPLYGLVLGWTYQAASKRLGIVDLFACEIATLCRVGTIFDIGDRYVKRYDKPSSENGERPQHRFVSQEDYFPVFQSNSRDLQSLEASVVYDITQFYTYMKAQRDAQRRLAETKLPEVDKTSAQKVKETDSRKCNDDAEMHAWHTAMMNVIFLTFLGYESARKAISSLVEYQPARAERLIVILLTELRCFAFLRQHFDPEDLHGQRLQLRVADYKEQVVAVYEQVMSPHGKNEGDWLQAQKTIQALERRYKEALGEDLAEARELRHQRLAERKQQCCSQTK
jgi:hypothetical protein